jgi:mycothiol synthase
VSAHVKIKEKLDDQETAGVLALVEAAAEADGVRPLSEHAMLHLSHGGDPRVRSVLALEQDTLVGYVHLDPAAESEGSSGELVVHPAHRRRGHGTRLLRAALDLADGRLRLWAHGDNPAAVALAAASGFERARSLWRMRRPLADPLPAYDLPAGVRLRTFVPGQDEQAWLRVNAAAFAHHPEQGAMDRVDLAERMAEPWFDPAGLLLAHDGDRLLAFHWTKQHSPTLGEVYVVGVDPAAQGRGLGKLVTLAGLRHLTGLGVDEIHLYVESDNDVAVSLYSKMGFTHADSDTHVMYRRAG